MKQIILISVAMLAAGCSSRIRLPPNPVTVSDFVQQIKHEVGEFERRKAEGPKAEGTCARDFDLSVSKLLVNMDVVLKRTSGATVGAELPLGTGSIGSSFSASSTITGTQNIAFTVVPAQPGPSVQPPPAPASDKFEGTPIADALLAVHSAFVSNSGYGPCITFGDGKVQEANKVKFGVRIERSRKAGATVKIVVFSLGATAGEDQTRENSMTAFFTLGGQAITVE